MRTRIDIEDLAVWAYRDQMVDCQGGGSWSLAGRPDSCVLLGATVGGDLPYLRMGYDVHPDADAVHLAVMRLERLAGAIVVRCAKGAARPDWMPGARLVMAADVTARGHPARLYDEAGKTAIGHKVRPAVELASGSLFYFPAGRGLTAEAWARDLIAGPRAVYSAWHEGLREAAAYLRQTRALSAHEVTGPSAESKPWESAPYRKAA
jgi:hypothetical protein